VLPGVFTAVEVDEIGYKGSGNTTMVEVQTLFLAFLYKSLRSACFNDPAFPGKKQNSCLWDYSPQAPDYQDFQSIRHQIQGNLLYVVLYFTFLLA
jgi:hypothetical protein